MLGVSVQPPSSLPRLVDARAGGRVADRRSPRSSCTRATWRRRTATARSTSRWWQLRPLRRCPSSRWRRTRLQARHARCACRRWSPADPSRAAPRTASPPRAKNDGATSGCASTHELRQQAACKVTILHAAVCEHTCGGLESVSPVWEVFNTRARGRCAVRRRRFRRRWRGWRVKGWR
jgi:hypothetical protein